MLQTQTLLREKMWRPCLPRHARLLLAVIAGVGCLVHGSIASAAEATAGQAPMEAIPLAQIFTLLFLMLGPFKIIGPFARITKGADAAFASRIALRAATKTNWEGTGITPDVPVAQDKALDKAQALALEKLAQKMTDEQAKARLTWALNALRAKTEPVAVDEAVLKKYVGRYGPGEVILENGRLLFLAEGRKMMMIPLSPTYFVLEGEFEIQVEFVPGKDAGTFDAIAHLADGGTQRFSRQAPPR